MNMRPVVTGMAVAAPNGLGLEEYWQAALEGRSGIRRISRYEPASYPSRWAGEIRDFDAATELPSRLLPQTDRMTRLALAVAERALADSGVDLEDVPRDQRGVVTAATAGGYEFGQRELQNLWSKGSSFVSAYQSFAWFYAVNTGQIGIRHNMRGPSGVVVSDHAGGLDALAQAGRNLRKGAKLMVSGAVDSSLSPWGWVGHLASQALSRAEGADRAYLPFDAAASGYVPGEGGAILVLENKDDAVGRGAEHVYGEIAGYAATFDPQPDSGHGGNLDKAITLALAKADLEPHQIGAVFADGLGMPAADRDECRAISSVFGPGAVPVTVPKSLTGRLCAGGAALDVATALLALRDGVLPPAAHTGRLLDGVDIDLVRGRARPVALDAALVLARGHGGFNAAMVLRRPQ